MVKIPITVENKQISLYMDNALHRNLTTKIQPKIYKKDKDWMLIIDGEEGTGKSVLAQQIGKVLYPELNLSNICLTPEEFTKKVINSKKGECIIFDEAFTGLSSRASLSETNRLLVSLMMEMRQKNLFVIIVMPTYFLLDKYVALHRARGLIHVYTKDDNRGYWIYLNKQKKKYLYLKGKPTYSYASVKSRLKGRFLDQYVVNEKAYREKKTLAFQKKSRNTNKEKYLQQRNILLNILDKEYGNTLQQTSQLCKKYGWKITQTAVHEAIKTLNPSNSIPNPQKTA